MLKSLQRNYENGFEEKLRSEKPSQYICTKKAKCNYEGGKAPLEFEEVFDNFRDYPSIDLLSIEKISYGYLITHIYYNTFK